MTTHHVTAHLTPSASSLTIDGVDVSRAVSKSGTTIGFTDDGAPVLTVQTMAGATIDLDAEGVDVRVERPRQLRAIDRLADHGVRGTDALTALDGFLERTADYLRQQLGTGLSATERTDWLVSVYGADAVRVALVLLAPEDSDSTIDALRRKLGGDHG